MPETSPHSGKYVAFVLEGNTAYEDYLVICRVNKARLQKVFDPDSNAEQAAGMTTIGDAALDFLKKAGAKTVYTPSDSAFIRGEVMGFKLYWERGKAADSPWKYHRPLTGTGWEDYFEKAGINLRILYDY